MGLKKRKIDDNLETEETEETKETDKVIEEIEDIEKKFLEIIPTEYEDTFEKIVGGTQVYVRENLNNTKEDIRDYNNTLKIYKAKEELMNNSSRRGQSVNDPNRILYSEKKINDTQFKCFQLFNCYNNSDNFFKFLRIQNNKKDNEEECFNISTNKSKINPR